MKKVLIVGGGITGLMTALCLHEDYKITVADAGADPRKNINMCGATYSGLDARHISFTETAPWTSANRHDLIMTKSSNHGWLCIPKDDLTDLENRWIAQFQKVASDKLIHEANTDAVIKLNKKSVTLWEKLKEEYDFLTPVNNTNIMPILCRTRKDLIDEFEYEHSLDENCILYENMNLPENLSALRQHLKDLGNFGYFTLHGNTYYVKKVCNDLINYLESHDVSFSWNQYIDEKILLKKNDSDIVVLCSGVSSQTSELLNKFDILLQGVVGCWVLIDNCGITIPCKIYGPEPVNYINITPTKTELIISGGYGFVGIRSYEEAVKLAKPIMEALIDEVQKWFPNSQIKEKAYCIRPALPTGVPTLATHHLDTGIPIIVAVGHAAGGFTQAPQTAALIKDAILASGR